MSLLRKCCIFISPKYNFVASRSVTARICTSVTTQKSKLEDEDVPYPFMSKFRQNKHRVQDSFKPAENYRWKYQPHVMIGCFGIFMFYFLIWREEHDLDMAINKVLYDATPGLEEQDLRKNIEKARKRGKDTQVYEDRLNVLLAKKSS